jgi:pimeloyl-ACP methyl ester carboxylesterase
MVLGMTDLHLHEFGPAHAPTLVLLHGLTEAGTAWPDAVGRWRERWHVVAVDLRGHGGSPRFTGDEIRRIHEIWLSDVLEVVRALPAAPIVVGHSLGGLLALRAGVAAPELVRALVLEDPARPVGLTTIDPEFVAHQETFLDTFTHGTAPEKARMRRESSWTPAEIDAWADCKPLVDRRMIRDGLSLGPADWLGLLAELRVPTLFVVGEDGEMAPSDDELSNPLIEIARLPGVGHCVRRDDPDAYHAVVDPFLELLRPREASADAR